MRAYTIKVSDVTGVGGHALPGDRVDVVLMRDLSTDASHHNYISQVVTQDIRVLGVDLNADLASNKPATPSTATLEVSVPDAQKLAVAGDLGKLSLLLRRTGSAEIAQTAPMRTEALFGAAPRSTGHATVRARARRPVHAGRRAPDHHRGGRRQRRSAPQVPRAEAGAARGPGRSGRSGRSAEPQRRSRPSRRRRRRVHTS